MADSYPATLSTPRANTTMTTDITVTAREIDFVTRFTRNWNSLREILGIMNPVKKTPGTRLTSYNATVSLEDGDVDEGEVVPYSKATVTPASYDDLKLRKYAKGITVEDVDQYGALIAVQRTDEAFLNEIQGVILDDFYDFLQTGNLTGNEATFQMAIAMAVGKVVDKFKKLRRNYGNVVVFVNTLDVYRYLGSANITIQTQNGIEYVKNFLGAQTMILSSEIPEGTVIATPADNIVLYYTDPADADYRQLGLEFTVDGETNLIGFHANGNYTTFVGESQAMCGMKLWAEYLDGIAVITIGESESESEGD